MGTESWVYQMIYSRAYWQGYLINEQAVNVFTIKGSHADNNAHKF